MTTLSARADGRRTKSANRRNRERWRGWLQEGLIETRTPMRTDGASSDRVDGAFKASDAVAVLKPASTARNPSVLAQILSKRGKVILGSLVTPMA
jgi:hypothetical protein